MPGLERQGDYDEGRDNSVGKEVNIETAAQEPSI
jgi:hypothetical protein